MDNENGFIGCCSFIFDIAKRMENRAMMIQKMIQHGGSPLSLEIVLIL